MEQDILDMEKDIENACKSNYPTSNKYSNTEINIIVDKSDLHDNFEHFFKYIERINKFVKLTRNPKKANTRDIDTLQEILSDKEQWLTKIKMELTDAHRFISAHNNEDFYNKMNKCFAINKPTEKPLARDSAEGYYKYYIKIINSKKYMKNIKSRMKKNKKRIEKNLERIDTLLLDKSPPVISQSSVISSPTSVISSPTAVISSPTPVISSPTPVKSLSEEVFGFGSPSMRSRRSSSTVYGFTPGSGEYITLGGKGRITKRRITKHKRRITKRKLSNHKRSTHNSKKRLKHNSNKRTTRRRR